MQYCIKPYIKLDNSIYHNKYDTLITEIMAMSIEELNEVISGIENVFAGIWELNSFTGQHMTSVSYDKEKAVISYFDDVIGEESTMEIYNMLKEYRDKLSNYENKKFN